MDDTQASSDLYRMAFLFLLFIALASIAVVLNRHTELNGALKQYSNCTQENKELIELKGECIVYKKRENITTALTAEKHMGDLMEMIKKRDNQVLSEGDQKEECVKLLKSCNDESNQLKEKLQETVSERDKLKAAGTKCSDQLSACEERTPSG